MTDPNVPIEPRQKWDNKIEFVLSCIGLSVGLGNIWRFPYVAYSNGGGAFLVPYVVLMILVGRPMYFLELIMGQFCSFGSIRAFGGFPMAKGVGWSMVYVCVMIGLYYNVILAYALVYFYYSFSSTLPWSSCDPAWADEHCYVRKEGVVPCALVNSTLYNLYEQTNGTANGTVAVSKEGSDAVVLVPESAFENLARNCTTATQTAPEQFFYKRVLGLTGSLEDLGSLQPEIACALVVAWICVFCCIFEGIRSSGKVVYVTAVAPFFIIGMLLVRGLTLEGASEGLKYYLIPEWSKVLEFKVWQKAAEQIFFSLSVAQGLIICFGSYNEFRNDLYKDVYIIAFADMIVSIVGGVVVFSILGNMANNLGVAVPDVVCAGFGLAFIAYPQAISLMSFSNFWSALFFLMLFFLAIDSEFALVESALIPFKDEFTALLTHERLLALVACAALCVLGMPMACQGGLYITTMLDEYVGGLLLPWNALFEIIFVIHGYGMKRLSLDIEFMLGEPPHTIVKICWMYICPGVLVLICVTSIITFKPLTLGNYTYSTWSTVLGVYLGFVGVQFIIICGLRYYYQSGLDCKKATQIPDTWGPALPEDQKAYKEFLHSRGIDVSSAAVTPPGEGKGQENPVFQGEGPAKAPEGLAKASAAPPQSTAPKPPEGKPPVAPQ